MKNLLSFFSAKKPPAKHARVVFLDPSSKKEFVLNYELYKSSAVETWLQLLSEANQKKSIIQRNGEFYGNAFHSLDEVTNDLSRVVETLRASNKVKIPHSIHKKLTRKDLNELHEIFENMMAENKRSSTTFREHELQAIIDLNTFIHRYEFAMDSQRGPWIVAAFYPSPKLPLTPELLTNFTMNKKFGELMMSYSTVGVGYLEAFAHKPEALPVPQQTASPDISIHFEKNAKFKDFDSLKEFLKTNYNRDINDPTLALGRIPLGALISSPASSLEFLSKLARFKYIKSVEPLSIKESEILEKEITPLLIFQFGDSPKKSGRIVFQMPSHERRNFFENIFADLNLKICKLKNDIFSISSEISWPNLEGAILPLPEKPGLYFSLQAEGKGTFFFLTPGFKGEQLKSLGYKNFIYLGEHRFSYNTDPITSLPVSCKMETFTDFPESN